MFSRFTRRRVDLPQGHVLACVGGEGPPLLLLHGHPQTHVMWHRVADELAERHTVVALDLPGYGDAWRPPVAPDHQPHSKRAMAAQVAEAMAQLGFERFAVCAHDRGARVAHRLALDAPERVSRLMLLDIAPTLAMYERTHEAFARAYWHWFFLIQPAPLPERLIEQDPGFYLRSVIGGRHAGLKPFSAEALAEYERCLRLPGTAQSICEDYRASAGIDLAQDRADREAGHHLTQPLRLLWGAHGAVGRCFDVMALWREVVDASCPAFSGRALDCGHYIAEEQPAALLDEIFEFFKE